MKFTPIPAAWGYIEPETVGCPCYGDIETCELCEGTGSVIGDKPTNVTGAIKALVLEARYAAGLPLHIPGDRFEHAESGETSLSWLLAEDGEHTLDNDGVSDGGMDDGFEDEFLDYDWD